MHTTRTYRDHTAAAPPADRKMPTARQQQLIQDRKKLTLGALFLLDHTPDPPEEMEWHNYAEWAITEHLERHSYYYYPKGKRTLVTAVTMRKRILEMCNINAKKPIQERHHGFKDKVAFVLGHGGTNLLREHFLKREEYDKSTFSESRLSKHWSEGDGLASAKTDERPDGEEVNGNDKSSTGMQVVDGQERCASGVAPPSRQSNLPSPSRHVSAPLQTSANSRTGLELKLGKDRERREQDGTNIDEQLISSPDERRQLRGSDSIVPQTQTLSAGNGTLSVGEEGNTAFSANKSDEFVPGAKRKLTQHHGSQKRQCHVDNATHEDDSSDRRPRPNAITQAEGPREEPSMVNSTKSPEVPQHPVANREKQHQPPLARLNLDRQGRNMKTLYSDIQEATHVVLSSIGTVRNTQSPLQYKPSCPLKDLYTRCWGPRWEEVRVRQDEEGFFTTPQVTASLLSAFLYEKVLARGARLEELLSNVVEVGGSLGEALLEEFDISSRGKSKSNLFAYT